MAGELFSLFRSAIASLAINIYFLPFRNILLKRLGLKSVFGCQLRSLDVEQWNLYNESNFISLSPSRADRTSSVSQGIFPSLNAYRLDGAIISPYQSAIIYKNTLLMPPNISDSRGRTKTSRGPLFCGNYRSPCVAVNPDLEIPKGILIGGAGAYNWFHFLTECLPKVYLCERLPFEFRDYPFILPSVCAESAPFRDALKLFLDYQEAQYYDYDDRIYVRDLIVFDEISHAPFAYSRGSFPALSDYKQHDDALLDFFAELRRRALTKKTYKYHAPSEKKLFIMRNSNRRNDNQDELFRIASDYGFESFSPERLSFLEQVNAFSSASALVGASGAAWAGMVFCTKPINCLSWLPPGYEDFSSYSTMANLLGHSMRFLKSSLLSRGNSGHGVHEGKYYVSPIDFENALKEVF